MDENYSLRPLKNLCCSNCNSQFCVKGFALKVSKCPRLLKCGHSLCDSCIKQNLKISNIIICPVCHTTCSADTKLTSEQFSFSLYVIGILTTFQIEKQEKDRKLALLGDTNFNYSIKDKDLNSCTINKSILCEECSTKASWSCENCQCHFCDPCWSRVHGAAKSLMKHVKLSISIVENPKTEYGKCPSHEMQDLDLFCKSCMKTVCSHCAIQSHQGGQHCLITMKEQSAEMVNQLKAVAEEAEMIYKRMKHTLQKVKFTQASLETVGNQIYSNLKTEILQNFARLHGILQLQEEKFLKQLSNKSNERENELRKLSVQLETQIQKAGFVLEKYENFVRKPQACDLNILYNQLSEVKTLPCYLISQNNNEVPSRVSFDESLIPLLENYCTVELFPDEVFELRSGSDLPEDFALEPLPDSNFIQRGIIPAAFGSNSDLDSVSNSSSRDLYDDSDTTRSKSIRMPKVLYEGRKYSVHITYINTPGEFYVTLNSQRKIKGSLEKKAMSCSYPFITPSAVSKDDIYLVKYKVDGKWYRGRVVQILSEGENNQSKALIHYIDYGNTDIVSLSWLKPLPPEVIEEPPLAVKCKLFNCVPKSGKWSKDSVKTMEKIVNGLTVTLFVMKIHPDCLEVDLSVIYPDGQIGRDIVSVRDALIFLECASFVGGAKTPENPCAVTYEEQYLPSVGESFDAIITHVNSPEDFYLHRTKQDGLFLCKLGADLQKYYEENFHKGVIYNPVVGMPCAARFSADKKWYRAKIDDLPGKKMVAVYYVDYGNREKIPWTDIRKLRDCFVKRPPLAMNCSMAEIVPVTQGNWSSQAKAYLGKCVLTKGMSVQIDGKHPSEPKLNVLLYEQIDNKTVCVNSLFVELGFAKSFNSPDESFSESLNNFSGRTKMNKNGKEVQPQSVKYEKTRKYKLSAKELRENYELEKRQCEETQENDCSNSEIVEFGDNIIKVKVQVLSAESPSSIYVTFSEGNEKFQNLQSKLNDFYENTTPVEGKEWSVGNKCAVYYSEGGCWCRASVCKIAGESSVTVFLKDFAVTVTVSPSLLRDLDPSFTGYGPRAIKCHLADVVSPGDTWPGVTCEYLAGELEEYTEIYMTKKGQIENNSLPIELWVQKVTPTRALEPTNVEWVTLNKLLVEKGLAVPKHNLWYSSGLVEERSVSSEKEVEDICDKQEKEDMEEQTVEPNTFLPSLSFEWSPAQPPKKSQFTGVATYVDHDGLIYVQDVDDQQQLLDIRDSLRETYGNSKPSAEDHFWSPGQICIARYFIDKQWYRGTILKTSELGKYKVLFVDYGNVETCQAVDLRKQVKFTEIPILVHKFKLHGVVPMSESEKWPIFIIELLHALIVDKQCEVTVVKFARTTEEPHVAIVKILPDEIDVASILVKDGMAEEESIDKNFLADSSEGEETEYISEDLTPKMKYVSLSIPKYCKGLHVLVKALRNENEFYGHLVDSEYLPPTLKNIVIEFEKLEETLAEECHSQPKLANFFEGEACCCVHSGINKWCRGQIETVSDNCVCVFFVDYGYKEFLSMDLVHECRLDWRKLPKMAVKFHVPNLVKSPNMSKAAYMKALTSRLMETKFYAEILNRHEDYLEVELSTEKMEIIT